MGFIRQEMPLETLLGRYLVAESRVLNVGSKARRVWPNSVNLDLVAGENVDVVGDAHDLPFPDSSYDACVLYAMLQYCERPWRVVDEVSRVLKPGGLAFVDVPFLQPYCPETAAFDRFRFTKAGLEGLFSADYDLQESGVTIATGSVMAQLGRATADTWIRNR
jgi:SAM-dependent methyltransferase